MGLVKPAGNGNTVVSASVGTVEATTAVTVKIEQRSVLLRFYRALGGDGWTEKTNWGAKRRSTNGTASRPTLRGMSPSSYW